MLGKVSAKESDVKFVCFSIPQTNKRGAKDTKEGVVGNKFASFL